MYRKVRFGLIVVVVAAFFARTPWPGSGSTYDDITAAIFDFGLIALIGFLIYDWLRRRRLRRDGGGSRQGAGKLGQDGQVGVKLDPLKTPDER